MIRPKIGAVLTLCLLLAACRDKPPQPPRVGEVFPNLPLPPHASFVSRAGGPEALQFTFRSPASADQVAGYYRNLFKHGGWKLVNDFKDTEGMVVLLAQQKGPPLWVRIHKADDGQGTMVELAGAVVPKKDSSDRKPAS
jgi:hypothetical protein